jgi:asparagine synthase (glutamine-hydrolysing)
MNDSAIHINELSDLWYRYNDEDKGDHISVRGYAFYNGSFLNGSVFARTLLEIFRSVANEEWKGQVIEIASRLNGFFSMIYRTQNLCFGMVDRVRSIPLFYTQEDNRFGIGDNPYTLLGSNSTFKFNPQSSVEFLLAGYVTGNETLHEDIHQIKPGEFVIAEKMENGSIQLSEVSYFSYFDRTTLDGDDEVLEEELYKRIERVFGRYASVFGSRHFLIPLSGGLDSRLIVAMFKQAGIKKVTCFSYGNPKSEDALLSSKVAHYLGYNWRFIPYEGRPYWTRLSKDKLFDSYLLFGSAFSSMAHAQDWPAVRHLIGDLEDPNPVFVPGHTGDFLSGGHLPTEIVTGHHGDFMDLVTNSILSHHYNLWPIPRMCHDLKQRLMERVTKILSTAANDRNTAAKCYEQWEWAGRQAKFIINSVRVYDFFKKDWLLPLWDNELVDFFMRLGVGEKYQKRIYINTLLTKVFSGKLSELSSIPVCSTTKLIYRKREGALTTMNLRKKITQPLLQTPGLNLMPILWRNYKNDIFYMYGYFAEEKGILQLLNPANSILNPLPLESNLPFMQIVKANMRKPMLMQSVSGLLSAQYLFKLHDPLHTLSNLRVSSFENHGGDRSAS